MEYCMMCNSAFLASRSSNIFPTLAVDPVLNLAKVWKCSIISASPKDSLNIFYILYTRPCTTWNYTIEFIDDFFPD